MSIARPPMIDSTSPVNTYGPGAWPGRGRLKLAAIVYHIAQGGFEGSLSWSKTPQAESSFNFIVAFDGRIGMRVSPFGLYCHWGNGIADPARTDLPPELAYLKAGTVNANWVTCSVEHEGEYDRPPFPTEAQYAATIRLVAWVMDFGGIGHERWRHQPHRAFSTNTRPNCPGPRFSIDRVYREALALLTPTPDPADAALEARYRAGGGRYGAKLYKGQLTRHGYAGPVLVTETAIICLDDAIERRLADDARGPLEASGELRRLG